MEKSAHKLVVFEDKQIRRIFHKGEWYFSIIDVVEVLTGSPNSRRYWSGIKTQLSEHEGFIQLYAKIVQLKLESSDGKKYATDTANTETVFRIIQSIPSPKAEPFKRWLAQVGYERIQEIEDPELATKRTYAIYKAKRRAFTDIGISEIMQSNPIPASVLYYRGNNSIAGSKKSLLKLEKKLSLLFRDIEFYTNCALHLPRRMLNDYFIFNFNLGGAALPPSPKGLGFRAVKDG